MHVCIKKNVVSNRFTHEQNIFTEHLNTIATDTLPWGQADVHTVVQIITCIDNTRCQADVHALLLADM